jgi:nucleosome binding factor SPN SPT16 subunit
MPFFVVTLNEIECVHLERVSFGLKNFDMVIINSDFTKPPVHVNSIDVKNLDALREYLDSCDICVTEGPVNLNWTQILSTIREDPYGFFAEGGWSFLSTDSDSEGADSDASASGSDFGDQVAESEVYDDDSSEEDEASDFDSDEDSEDGSASEGDDDSGEDWDEMERKAKRADDKRDTGRDSDDDDRGKKKGSKRR